MLTYVFDDCADRRDPKILWMDNSGTRIYVDT